MTLARSVFVVSLVVLTHVRADGQQQTPTVARQAAEKAISALEEQACTAFGAKSPDLLRKLLSDDFVMSRDFDLQDRDFVLQSDEMPGPACQQAQLEVSTYGTAASAYGFLLDTHGEQELISDNWVKSGDEWKMAFRRSARLEPKSYVEHALDLMQRNSWKRNEVNWPTLRTATLKMAVSAKNSLDTYGALRFALTSLGDHHSHLLLSPALQGMEAKSQSGRGAAGESAAVQSDGAAPQSVYIGRYQPEGHIESQGDRKFAFVVVPKFPSFDAAEGMRYSETLQRIIAELDSAAPSGWIVDLRGNVGGNMWPMLAGVGPLLGESSNLGGFRDISGATANWTYRDGIAGLVMNGKESGQTGPLTGKAYRLREAPAVAVLIDSATGSSGEAVAIAFRGRSRTKFFGEHTGGFSTVNQFFVLVDGAILNMTVGVDVDRNGIVYLDGVSPDELQGQSDSAVRGQKDPVIQSAMRWLRQQ